MSANIPKKGKQKNGSIITTYSSGLFVMDISPEPFFNGVCGDEKSKTTDTNFYDAGYWMLVLNFIWSQASRIQHQESNIKYHASSISFFNQFLEAVCVEY